VNFRGQGQVTNFFFHNRANNIPQFATQGFELRRADGTNDASDVARVFRQAKLEGKQLWYFTAPSSVPITVVEKMAIPVEKAEQGKAILSHEGEDYGMSFDDSLTSKTIKLLIPNKAGDKYSIRTFSFGPSHYLHGGRAIANFFPSRSAH
jgi:hypothetical protein